MCSSHHSQPWVWLCRRSCSNCCSMVWACACRCVDTRTYIATFITVLLLGRFLQTILWNSKAPSDQILVRLIPPPLPVGCWDDLTPDAKLPCFHTYPPENHLPVRVSQ